MPRLSRYLLVAVMCGCWRGEARAPAPTPPAPAAPRKGASCDEVAENAHDVLERADDRELAARAIPLQGLVLRRCQSDAWSVELRRCVAGATTVADADTCAKLATPDQHNAFEREIEVWVVTEDGQ